jgi:hypothetical protein
MVVTNELEEAVRVTAAVALNTLSVMFLPPRERFARLPGGLAL